jgi:hypothetical protein
MVAARVTLHRDARRRLQHDVPIADKISEPGTWVSEKGYTGDLTDRNICIIDIIVFNATFLT